MWQRMCEPFLYTLVPQWVTHVHACKSYDTTWVVVATMGKPAVRSTWVGKALPTKHDYEQQ